MKIGYLVSGKFHQSAFKAWERSSLEKTTPILTLGHKIENFDYNKVPIKTIRELEDELVHKLYNDNPHLRLFYSGGTDSYSIAKAFARNGIPCKYTFLTYESSNKEIIDSDYWKDYHLKKLRDLLRRNNLSSPDIETIVVDEKRIEDNFSDPYFFESVPFYGSNGRFSMSNYGTIAEKSKFCGSKHTNIFGIEKPRLYVDHKGIFWKFNDKMGMTTYSPNIKTVWFYLNFDFPEIISRQCWDVISYCKKRFRGKSLIESLETLQTDKNFYNEWCLALGRHSDPWLSMKCALSKPSNNSSGRPLDERHTHLKYFSERNTKGWRNYNCFLEEIKSITGEDFIPQVDSKKFYIRTFQ